MAGLNPLYPAPDKWRPGDNFLDNWYFVGGGSQLGWGHFPINQRGRTEYEAAEWAIDRWLINAGNVRITSQGISLEQNSILDYRVAEGMLVVGLKYTLSIYLSNGKCYGLTFAVGYDNWNSIPFDDSGFSGRLTMQKNDYGVASIQSVSASTDVYVQAAKLELGDHQTLAHKEGGRWVVNRVPDFREELAKCQAYQIIENKPCNGILGRVEGDEKSIVAFIPTPVTPRANGTFSISSANIVGNGTWAHLSNAYGTATAEAGGVSIMITGDFSSFGPFHLVNMWIENGYSLDFNL